MVQFGGKEDEAKSTRVPVMTVMDNMEATE